MTAHAITTRCCIAGGGPAGSGGRIGTGRFMAMIDRGEYWQCAYVIHKGGFDEIRARGLQALRDDVAALAPGSPGAWNATSRAGTT